MIDFFRSLLGGKRMIEDRMDDLDERMASAETEFKKNRKAIAEAHAAIHRLTNR